MCVRAYVCMCVCVRAFNIYRLIVGYILSPVDGDEVDVGVDSDATDTTVAAVSGRPSQPSVASLPITAGTLSSRSVASGTTGPRLTSDVSPSLWHFLLDQSVHSSSLPRLCASLCRFPR